MGTAHPARLLRAFAAGVVAMVVLWAAAPASATTLPAGFAETQVASGFSSPVAAAWAPDGRMFVAEKPGRVRVVNRGSSTASTLLDINTKVNARSDRGMLGIATDKDFATNGWLYLLYVKELQPALPDSDGPMVSVLTRVTVNADNTLQNPSSPETTILGTADTQPCPTPNNTVDCIPADYKWHVIGTVRSDPVDGTLWVGTGDTHAHVVDENSYRPYDESTYAGKILHVDRNGKGLPGHPFCPADTNLDHVCTKIYAKGFRNPFRFSLRPGKGPVVGDVGNSAHEELNLIKPGKSYGWPCYEGGGKTPLYATTARCAQEYAKAGTSEAHTPPNWSYPHGGGASITGGPVYAGANYPAEYRGDIFVGDYVQQWVKRIEVDSNDTVTGVHDFETAWSTGVAIESMPGTQDLAYVDIGWGRNPPSVRRWSYADGNGIPTPRASATPSSGNAPLTVQFRGDQSSDPEGTPLTYDWDFGDGTPHSTAANPSHTYTTNGSYTARLTVDDGTGRNPSTTVTVQVGGNTAPSVSISAPADESLFRDGQTISVSGTGTDLEDGLLPGTSLSWHVLLHHGTHIHDLTEFTGASGSFTTATDHDADSYYEIRLTATDSSGSRTTRVVEIRPQTVNVAIASSPAGAPIGYGGDALRAAPFTKTSVIGFQATLNAAESFVKDGVTYRFKSWSDGGGREHVATIPAADTTLTATYEPEAGGTLRFTPEADTYVDNSLPTTTFGGATTMGVDASPVKQAFLRFQVSGLAGRKVGRVRLRMHQKDASGTGGRVYKLGTNTWSESGMTWNTKPAIGGTPVASFGGVSAGSWYEVDLGSAFVTADGTVSVAIDTPSGDGNKWASRESITPPELIVDLDTGTTPSTELTKVAAPTVGSSQPTYYSSNHRTALTAGGRALTVYGRLSQGVQLAWRDAGGGWQSATRGAVADGLLLGGTGTGDWPASIAVARDASGAEHAWVVWSGARASSSTPRPVQMRRLTGLDDPAGPSVGPLVTVDAPALGAYRADIAFERSSTGATRGVIAWTRKASTAPLYELATTWFTDLGTDTPSFTGGTVLASSSSSNRYVTLEPAPGGMRAIQRGSSSKLRFSMHSSSAALTSWTGSVSGAVVDSAAAPAGVALASGEVLATADLSLSAGTVVVQRWNALGSTVGTDLQLTGYTQPSLATDGTRAWLVMVRKSDGFVVSRQYEPSTGWTAADRVEIGADGGGGYAWPNLVRDAGGHLRLTVRGTGSSTSRSAVLAFQRSTGVTTATTQTAPMLTSATLGSTELADGGESIVVSYSLSKRAAVTLQVERRVNRCAGGKRVRPCLRWSKPRRARRARGRRGRNRVRFDGKVSGRRLPPGRYRLSVEAGDRAGNLTRSRELTFRVVRGR
jgi:glucose/arabinose dehydrogenase